MTGKAREHETRIMGLGLALAMLVALLAIWFAATLGAQLRSHAQGTPGTQGSSSSLGVLERS